jgi:hypothetical protein
VHFAHGIAQANAQQRLPRILKDVNHLALRAFEIDALAVSQQVIFRTDGDGLGQPAAQLSLQEPHNAAHLLQRESFTAKRADYRDLGDVISGIEPMPALAARHHDPSLVPPLELPWSNSRKPDYLRGCEPLFHDNYEMFKTFLGQMFETL